MSTQRLLRFFDLGAAQLASGFVQAGVNMAGQAINARAQKEENQKNRDFQMMENARARKWQEDMFNKYQSPQAQVQQRMQAGLNPYAEGAVTSQSVGSASTHSLPAGIAPSFGNALTEGASAMIAGMNSYSQRKLQREQAEYTKAQTISEYQDQILNRLKTSKDLAVLDAEIKLKQEQARGSGLTADIAKVELSWLEDLKSKGINPNEDTHNESVARTSNLDSQTALNDARKAFQNLENEFHDTFQRQFYNLNLQERRTQVREFLDTSEVRVALQNAELGFAKLAMNEATRLDLLNQITNEYDRHIAQAILNAVKDGNGIDGVLLNWLARDPSSTLSVIDALAKLKPSLKKG